MDDDAVGLAAWNLSVAGGAFIDVFIKAIGPVVDRVHTLIIGSDERRRGVAGGARSCIRQAVEHVRERRAPFVAILASSDFRRGSCDVHPTYLKTDHRAFIECFTAKLAAGLEGCDVRAGQGVEGQSE